MLEDFFQILPLELEDLAHVLKRVLQMSLGAHQAETLHSCLGFRHAGCKLLVRVMFTDCYGRCYRRRQAERMEVHHMKSHRTIAKADEEVG